MTYCFYIQEGDLKLVEKCMKALRVEEIVVGAHTVKGHGTLQQIQDMIIESGCHDWVLTVVGPSTHEGEGP